MRRVKCTRDFFVGWVSDLVEVDRSSTGINKPIIGGGGDLKTLNGDYFDKVINK